MLDLKALPLLRKNMREFIKADPVQLVLYRPQITETDTGGYIVGASIDMPPQQFRLVPYKRRITIFTAQTADGDLPTVPWVLVGEPHVNIRRDDTFTYQDDQYKVISVEPKMQDPTLTDRVVAEIMFYGKDEAPPDPIPA